ncbi:MAG TPA: DUF4279 domain-containing protein [Blastocatellia bacterium]|jgi:hypothetical protein|nr:DUF4279 domain-containing protein [Blastocatellia bacterium]
MDETYAYFAVVGSGMYAIVSERLGLGPSRAWNEGDPKPSGGTYSFMRWCLETDIGHNRPVQEHLEVLLPILEDHAEAIRSLAPQYEAVIQCVGYFGEPSPGFHLDAPTIARIAALGLAVDFDLYSMGSRDDG